MKILKKLIIPFTIILILIIYIINIDNKIYYVSIGDELSSNSSIYIKQYLTNTKSIEHYTNYTDKEIRTTDIINNIKENIRILEDKKIIPIKKALMHADVITLSTGLNEITYKLNNTNINEYEMYKYIDELMVDIDTLIDIIKRYCKEDIFILGYYNPFINRKYINNNKINNIINYANNKLINICDEEKINYIDINYVLKNNNKFFTVINSYYPNNDGYELISREIINKIDKKVLKDLKTT